MSENVFVGQVL